MPSRFTIDRELVIRLFFAAFAFLLSQAFLMARPFLPSVLIAIIFSMMFYPIYRRLLRKIRKPGLASLIMTIGIVLMIVLPIIFAVWMLIAESSDWMPVAQNVLAQTTNGNVEIYREKIPDSLVPYLERLSTLLSGINIDLRGVVLENAQLLGARISAIGHFVARNSLIIIFKFLIMILCLFFMFRDGENLFMWILRLLPMEASHKQAVSRTAYETFWAVTIGVFLTAAAQGITAMIGFFLAGVRMPVLLGLGVGMVSLLGASFLICIPVALFTMLESTGKGVFLLFWGAILVGWLDNLLKPMLIGSRARMPFVLVFFSILGGIQLYGLVGLLLGPMVVACVLTFIRIFRETYGS